MLQSTGTTYATLIDSSTTGTFVSLEIALPSKEIGEPIKLQLFDSTPATSGLITHHHFNIISLANGLNFPVNLLATQLHRAMPIILVVDEDCLKPPNPESIHQPILVDLKEEKSVSTPPNPPSPQANPIPSHATPSEQLPQPRDDTAQPQNSVIPLLTPSLTFPEPNITSLKPPSELPNNLDIRIIGTAPFAQII
ncbi:hypothetical protein C0995_003698 [Termitomyces sp. Mi166|nr:hypothetical protein C0995_003698 [Termitomyces sp. Mi166\